MPPGRIKTISQYHHMWGLPKPEHPLISVINTASLTRMPEEQHASWLLDFYSISLKRASDVKYKYGQQAYDFDEGVLFFMAPNQVFGIEIGPKAVKPAGWILLVHPDFLWNTPLAKTIKNYEYFQYSVREALFLSAKEETILNGVLQTIQQEYHANIDKFSQQIIISQLETLLNFAERFYHRQFITRKIGNHQVLARLEEVLATYLNSADLHKKGLPTVQYVADTLTISPTYLRGLLKSLIGLNVQQYIHEKVIDKAKERLSATTLTVGEIAYELGFEHSQSFSKLFKTKTALSPLQFRQSFN